MKSRLNENKWIIYNFGLVALITVAIALIIFTKENMGEVSPVYYPTEDVYGYPFDIGFRWISVLGITGVTLLQCSCYGMTQGSKSWRLLSWSYGFMLYNISGFNNIFSSSARIFTDLRLRDAGYDLGFNLIRFWNYGDYLIYLSLIVVGLIFVCEWFTPTIVENESESDSHKAKTILSIFLAVLSICLLVIRTFTNPWYLLLCAASSSLSWIILLKEERFLAHIQPQINRTGICLSDILIDRLIHHLSDDDMDEYDDDFDSNLDMSKYTLDLLLNFAESLEKEDFDDKSKKEYMVKMIKRLRENYDINIDKE